MLLMRNQQREATHRAAVEPSWQDWRPVWNFAFPPSSKKGKELRCRPRTASFRDGHRRHGNSTELFAVRQTVFFHAINQCSTADVQIFGSVSLVAFEALKGTQD